MMTIQKVLEACLEMQPKIPAPTRTSAAKATNMNQVPLMSRAPLKAA